MNPLYSFMLACLLLSGCAKSPMRAAGQPHEAQESPTLVLWSRSPSPSIDRSPRFAAYPTGVIIYRRQDSLSEAPRFMRAELPREQYRQVLGSERLKALSTLERSYFLSEGLHAPDHVLQWRGEGDRVHQVTVNGILDKGDGVPDRHRAPPAFLAVFDALTTFNAPDAKTYKPEAVEVLLAPVSSSDSEVPWPTDWPAPAHLKAVLPGTRFEEVYRWVWARQEAGQTARFNNESYAVWLQAVLPGHPDVVKPADESGPKTYDASKTVKIVEKQCAGAPPSRRKALGCLCPLGDECRCSYRVRHDEAGQCVIDSNSVPNETVGEDVVTLPGGTR